ncbi:MAG: hypothetical protein KGJ86_14960 [Chloroflexota bacterium]|nr:hypothetical protein [Chloroflexota bacterium]
MSWFWMNQAMADLHVAANRERFATDPDGYLAGYQLTDEERRAIKNRDILKLWDLGAQPYIMRGFQRRTGMSDSEFRAALKDRSYSERL